MRCTHFERLDSTEASSKNYSDSARAASIDRDNFGVMAKVVWSLKMQTRSLYYGLANDCRAN